MRRTYIILFFCCLMSAASWAGTGSEASPLTVAEAKNKATSTTTKYWVTGYIVGEMCAYSNNKWFYHMAPPFDGSVFLLADSPDEYDLARCVCVQFPTSSNGSEDYNLEDNGHLWRKKIVLQGTREQYNNMAGLKKVSDVEVIDDDLSSAADLWLFYETFEDGTFTPTVSSDKWQGGQYEVREYADRKDKVGTVVRTWQLTNAIIDDGKPKWDDKCASLRNQNATLELTTDLAEGIGTVEMWAGNYEDYGTAQMALSVFVSADGGTSWTQCGAAQQVAKTAKATSNGMSIYRVQVNKQGPARIKIVKADANTGKGLQIDEIKMSRYSGTTTALNEVQSQNDVDIATTGGRLVMTLHDDTALTVYDIVGHKVFGTHKAGTYSIDINSGIYIIRTRISTRKIMI